MRISQVNFELTITDPDIESITIKWFGPDTIYITQIEKGGTKAAMMFNVEEAKQLAAVLDSFVQQKLVHTSDCALFNSPAIAIKPCTCDATNAPIF